MICAIPADDVREWPLDADISFSTDAWIEGPGVPLSEGEWLVTAAAHFTVTEPFHGIVYAELFDGANEYGLQARTFRRSIFSGNNAIGIINTMAVLDVGAEGATVTLRVRAHSDHPENAHNYTPASGVLEAVCPAVIPVPGQPPPETPENPHQSNFATHITAAKLQTIVPSPLLERLAADASVVWSRNTFP